MTGDNTHDDGCVARRTGIVKSGGEQSVALGALAGPVAGP